MNIVLETESGAFQFSTMPPTETQAETLFKDSCQRQNGDCHLLANWTHANGFCGLQIQVKALKNRIYNFNTSACGDFTIAISKGLSDVNFGKKILHIGQCQLIHFPAKELNMHLQSVNHELELVIFLIETKTTQMLNKIAKSENDKPEMLLPLTIDLSIQTAIKQWQKPIVGQINSAYLLAKILEIKALYDMKCDEKGNQPYQFAKTEYDRERILFARDYLVQQVVMPPDLITLSRIAGINLFKLKMGFKELFQQSIYSYLATYRLEKAKEYLLTGSKSIGQIAFELGFSSSQHLSAAFKKAFGQSPSQLRKPAESSE